MAEAVWRSHRKRFIEADGFFFDRFGERKDLEYRTELVHVLGHAISDGVARAKLAQIGLVVRQGSQRPDLSGVDIHDNSPRGLRPERTHRLRSFVLQYILDTHIQ